MASARISMSRSFRCELSCRKTLMVTNRAATVAGALKPGPRSCPGQVSRLTGSSILNSQSRTPSMFAADFQSTRPRSRRSGLGIRGRAWNWDLRTRASEIARCPDTLDRALQIRIYVTDPICSGTRSHHVSTTSSQRLILPFSIRDGHRR